MDVKKHLRTGFEASPAIGRRHQWILSQESFFLVGTPPSDGGGLQAGGVGFNAQVKSALHCNLY